MSTMELVTFGLFLGVVVILAIVARRMQRVQLPPGAATPASESRAERDAEPSAGRGPRSRAASRVRPSVDRRRSA